MFSGIKDFIRNKIFTSKKFVAGANLIALMAFASPAGIYAEEQNEANSTTVTNPADYFAMCVERNIKPDTQLYKFHKGSRQYRQKLMETNYDLWIKLYRQNNAVYDKCKEETLEFSEKQAKNVSSLESNIERRGYTCEDNDCKTCMAVDCSKMDDFCIKPCEDVLQNDIDSVTSLNKSKEQKLAVIQKAFNTKNR